jgi:hypothetical protein
MFGLCRGNRRDRGHIGEAGRTVVIGLKTSTGLAAPDDQLVDDRLLDGNISLIKSGSSTV